MESDSPLSRVSTEVPTSLGECSSGETGYPPGLGKQDWGYSAEQGSFGLIQGELHDATTHHQQIG